MKTQNKLKRILKFFALLTLTTLLSINLSQAARVYVNIGTGYPNGSPYGPYAGYPYTTSVVYVPGHWYHGYWIPGQYIEYAGPPPGAGYVWYQGSYGSGHWHHGYWRHSRHHH